MKSLYTTYSDPEIDRTIERHMEIIINEVRQAVSDVDSIVLAGGFGRGEGTVTKLPNGKYLPMNDYDIYIFSNNVVPYHLYQGLTKRLKDRIGVEIDMKFIKTSSLRFLIPDMFTFELKSASRVIWGKDLRSQIPLGKKDVPLSAGLNTLFIEMLGLILNFEPEYFIGKIPSDRVMMLNYQCSKVFIEICNALSLLGNFYEPSCSKRADLLCRHYGARFVGLSKVLTDLPSKVRHHTDLKLRSLDFNTGEPVKNWLEARDALKYALWYFASRVLQKPFDVDQDFLTFLRANQRGLASIYFEPYLQYAFRRTRIPAVPALMKTAMPTVCVYENLRYMRNCYNRIGRVYLRPLLRLKSPLINIYLSSALLLYSIENEETVDVTLLRGAYQLINSMYRCKPIDYWTLESWSTIRDASVHCFKTYASTPRTITF